MVSLVYHSGWVNPLLHCSLSGGPWQDLHFTRTERYFWHTIDISPPCEFVLTDGRGNWDNPAPHCAYRSGNNYEINNPGQYALFRGEVIPITPATKRVLLVSDLDGTLLEEYDPEADDATLRFARYWLQWHYFSGSKLVYSTGRSMNEYLAIKRAKKALLDPDVLILDVGSDAYTINSATGEYEILSAYQEAADTSHWDTEVVSQTLNVHFPWLIHPSTAENMRLKTWRIARIEDVLAYQDQLKAFVSDSANWPSTKEIHCIIHISGSGSHRYIDFTASNGAKMAGVTFCKSRFGFSDEDTIVAGDSGNDLSMFRGQEWSVAPENSLPEMKTWLTKKPRGPRKYISQLRYADAVVDAVERVIAADS